MLDPHPCDAPRKIWTTIDFVDLASRDAVDKALQRLTKADRLANVRTGQTALDSLAHAPQEEKIQVYGDVAVYTTLLTIRGRYSGQGQQGAYRGLVVWIRRDGRWQQIASQLTPVLSR